MAFFQIPVQKPKKKAIFVPNLRIFIFPLSFAWWKIQGFQKWKQFFQIPA